MWGVNTHGPTFGVPRAAQERTGRNLQCDTTAAPSYRISISAAPIFYRGCAFFTQDRRHVLSAACNVELAAVLKPLRPPLLCRAQLAVFGFHLNQQPPAAVRAKFSPVYCSQVISASAGVVPRVGGSGVPVVCSDEATRIKHTNQQN